MKLADIVNRLAVDPRKLTDYALDPDSPWGHHKARVFPKNRLASPGKTMLTY